MKEVKTYYHELFKHMDNEHDRILLDSEMDDIVRIVERMQRQKVNVWTYVRRFAILPILFIFYLVTMIIVSIRFCYYFIKHGGEFMVYYDKFMPYTFNEVIQKAINKLNP